MKKTILSVIVLAVAISSVTAQTLRNKKGTPILPKAGDWGVGISATPFINTLGNFIKINKASNFSNQANFSFTDGQSFFGKYFVKDNVAIRARVDLDLASQTYKFNSVKDQAIPDPTVTVEDKRVRKSTNITAVVGKEFRKGSSRLQGFYGYQGGLGIMGSSNSYEYGNAYSTTNINPTDRNFNGNISGSSRTISNKSAKTISVMAGGFVGAEYFVMPRVSIGGELSWMLRISSTGTGTTDVESWDATALASKNTKSEIAGGSFFGANNYGGSLYIMLYF